MQEGWKRRREMEAEIGRRALRQARRLERVPGSIRDCCSEEERVAYAAHLIENCGDEAREELDVLEAEPDAVGFAIRVLRRELTPTLRR